MAVLDSIENVCNGKTPSDSEDKELKIIEEELDKMNGFIEEMKRGVEKAKKDLNLVILEKYDAALKKIAETNCFIKEQKWSGEDKTQIENPTIGLDPN